MAHVDLWDIVKDVPDAKLAGHFRRYLEGKPDAALVEDKSDAEVADLLRTASTGAQDDFVITKVFDYAMTFVRNDG